MSQVFIVYTDINRLERHMIELAPEDKDVIQEFANGIRTMIHFPMPVEKARELYGPIDGLIDPRVDNGTFCTKIEYA